MKIYVESSNVVPLKQAESHLVAFRIHGEVNVAHRPRSIGRIVSTGRPTLEDQRFDPIFSENCIRLLDLVLLNSALQTVPAKWIAQDRVVCRRDHKIEREQRPETSLLPNTQINRKLLRSTNARTITSGRRTVSRIWSAEALVVVDAIA